MTSAPQGPPAEELLRDLTPLVLGSVARRFGDFSAAEDAVQEALIAAMTQWPREGVPLNPRGWLIQVASRRMTDHIRKEIARRRREGVVLALSGTDEPVQPAPDVEGDEAGDDTLTLLFTCCHVSLSAPSAIALTLRAVGGLTTAEIANAFMVPETTMGQRISRAKQSIKASGVPFGLLTEEDRAARLGSVLHILYLMFNEGYTSSIGAALQRVELAREAIRLTRAVRELLPEDPEVQGLLALMLLTDARRLARTGPGGELIPLDKQDRSLWDQQAIHEGLDHVREAFARGRVGPYQIQAAIAAVHDEAKSTAATDWPQILALYRLLLRMTDNPMAALNHAIAAAMVEGPAKGLSLLEGLDVEGRLRGHYRLDAVRGHLLEMAGDHAAAIQAFRLAAERTACRPERDYLTTQAARLGESTE